jgi:hypothetical protein
LTDITVRPSGRSIIDTHGCNRGIDGARDEFYQVLEIVKQSLLAGHVCRADLAGDHAEVCIHHAGSGRTAAKVYTDDRFDLCWAHVHPLEVGMLQSNLPLFGGKDKGRQANLYPGVDKNQQHAL